MFWAALFLPSSNASPPTDADADSINGLATWCLQFTPRVAVVECIVTVELQASVRLFGGKRRLVQRVRDEAPDLGVDLVAWAPTCGAAIALGRAGVTNGFRGPLEHVLDALPIGSINAVRKHATVLSHIGCKTLGDVRRLPRGGLGRRFDKALLAAMDEAYGLRPEVHAWVTLPEAFSARLELMARVELAAALLFGARRLLLVMCGWLAARHAGVTAFTLRWTHDTMKPKDVGDHGELTVRTAKAMRDIEHLGRLLAEHLAQVELQAPAGALELVAVEVHALEEHSDSLFPDAQDQGESLTLVIERIAARLGPESVLRPVVREDHRQEWMCHWQPAAVPLPRKSARTVDIPQPTFVFAAPLRLAMRGDRPLYQGVLQLLAGPHRVEGGWWDRTVDEGGESITRHVARDYWVALSEHAGVLWIFQTRLAEDQTTWFLHGVFA